MKEIAKLAGDELISRNWSKADLVRHSGLSRATVDRLLDEADDTPPQRATLERLASAFEWHLDPRTMKLGPPAEAPSLSWFLSQTVEVQQAILQRSSAGIRLAYARALRAIADEIDGKGVAFIADGKRVDEPTQRQLLGEGEKPGLRGSRSAGQHERRG